MKCALGESKLSARQRGTIQTRFSQRQKTLKKKEKEKKKQTKEMFCPSRCFNSFGSDGHELKLEALKSFFLKKILFILFNFFEAQTSRNSFRMNWIVETCSEYHKQYLWQELNVTCDYKSIDLYLGAQKGSILLADLLTRSKTN